VFLAGALWLALSSANRIALALRPDVTAVGGLGDAALAAAWIIGLGAGAIQVARGAHFASHVLWTAWVAWAVTLAAARLAPPRA
jgi:membrane-associated PAP2 superfamily phosphatase